MRGTSPARTTSVLSRSIAPAAASSAPPVPSAVGCATVTTSPGSGSSAETTTTTRAAPAARAAATGQPISGRPQRSWASFGVAERILVPRPAARITTVPSIAAPA